MENIKQTVLQNITVSSYFITGPPTHSVGGQTGDGHWRLSSSVVVCNTRIYNVTHRGAARDGGPVVLRPVRATPCLTSKCFIYKVRKVQTSKLCCYITMSTSLLQA